MAKTASYLKRHKATIHIGVIYTCEKCNFSTSRSKELAIHTKQDHTDISFVCDLCDYEGTQAGNLKTHKEIIHQGVRYPCDKCEYKASTPVLRSRIRSRLDPHFLPPPPGAGATF